MVVKTRSHNKKLAAAAAAADAAAAAADAAIDSGRRVRIVTPSFRDASIRTYKLYSPTARPSSSSLFADLEERQVAAEALVELQQEDNQCVVGALNANICLNPMRPITQYMYCINVFNSDITLHYKTAYVLYDNTTRLYYVYSIVSNCFPDSDAATATAAATAAATGNLPEPVHTVQMKYTSFTYDLIVNYIMTMIVPSNEYDYFIQDDIVGITVSKEDFVQTAFGPDSSYYDINHLFNENTSRETINGYNTFHLIPSRKYWHDPTSAIGPSYTESVINSMILLLSQSE
jgi:hypothetical protein